MNRIQLFAEQPPANAPQTPEVAEWDLFNDVLPETVAHQFFAPLHYEKNYAYPLVVWLHGPGGSERELLRVMPKISTRNYVGVGPRGNRLAVASRGYEWDGDELHLADAEQGVFESIEAACRRFNIARHRIFLAGFESGGVMAFRIGMRHPGHFAGVLSVGGPFPLGQFPLAFLDEVRGLPLFIAQGRDSQEYPVERTCEELRLFHVAGMSVTVRQYPCGDELDTQMLHDMDTWIMEHVTGASCDSQSESSLYPGEAN